MIKTKSVHSAIHHQEDGLRILATRYRGRGMLKSRYDEWMASLGPSEQLLKSFRVGDVTWLEFRRRYRRELFDSSSDFDRANKGIKNHGQKFTLRLLQELGHRGNITLMCHCDEDEQHCHRHVLARILAGKIG
jgi:uncharacterized protein YeaO (DUF488 family)